MFRLIMTALFWLPAFPVGAGVKALLLRWEQHDIYVLLFIYASLICFSMYSDLPKLRNRFIEAFRP